MIVDDTANMFKNCLNKIDQLLRKQWVRCKIKKNIICSLYARNVGCMIDCFQIPIFRKQNNRRWQKKKNIFNRIFQREVCNTKIIISLLSQQFTNVWMNFTAKISFKRMCENSHSICPFSHTYKHERKYLCGEICGNVEIWCFRRIMKISWMEKHERGKF